MSADLETPKYTVLASDGPFELRRYAPYVVATTTVPGTFDAASRAGFRIIAGYIFGGNAPKQSIAMTAPVSVAPVEPEDPKPVSAEKSGDGWRVAFMMPSEYALEDLPQPDDDRVVFETQPTRCVASVRFTGFTTRASIEKQTLALKRWMTERGLATDGLASVERYNDPFTLPWRRRNEVILDASPTACPTEGDRRDDV